MSGHLRRGSFDTVRLAAALMVFHSHSFALAGYREPGALGYAWGACALVIFFAISGYWISESALQRSVTSYAVARFLRIVPGLFVCCLVTIGLCALATSEPVNAYLREGATWQWLNNALPFFLRQVGDLPGVFEDGVNGGVNGSLWTLPYEVLCYVLAGVAALFGRKGMRTAMAAAAIFCLPTLLAPPPGRSFHLFAGDFDLAALATFLGAFVYGAWLRGADRKQFPVIVGAIVFGLLLVRHDDLLNHIVAALLFATLAIWAGRELDLDRQITRGRDLSYGVYIYAFPCEQLALRALPPHDRASFALYYLVALASALVLAWISWTVVEQPALRAKGALARAIEGGFGRLRLAPSWRRATPD